MQHEQEGSHRFVGLAPRRWRIGDCKCRRLDQLGQRLGRLATDHLPVHQHLQRSGGALRDVAPTLLALLGLPQPADMSGRSLIDA